MQERIIYSIFDVMGRNEISLTRALASVLFKDLTTLNRLLKACYHKNAFRITKGEFRKTRFSFERDHYSSGRTDIEIINDAYHIIIEAKIKNNQITIAQALKYSEVLKNSLSKNKLFIFLLEIDNGVIPKNLFSQFPMINFSKISWLDIYSLLNDRKTITINLVEELLNGLKYTHDMKIHDIDIWAVSVKDKELKNLENKKIYRNYKNRN